MLTALHVQLTLWFWGVQFQSMLWRLLGHALDLSNPESDTLVEEALRLLVNVLNCTTAFLPALQVSRAGSPCSLTHLLVAVPDLQA